MTDNRRTTRRELLKILGGGAGLAAAGACVPVATTTPSYPRGYSRQPWVAPRVSMDNVIRVIVGHRPYRPSGFVVKRETFDDKTVVHNYGHGGSGLSLCWGSSALAVRETMGMTPGEVAVVGSGIMGLRCIQVTAQLGGAYHTPCADEPDRPGLRHTLARDLHTV